MLAARAAPEHSIHASFRCTGGLAYVHTTRLGTVVVHVYNPGLRCEGLDDLVGIARLRDAGADGAVGEVLRVEGCQRILPCPRGQSRLTSWLLVQGGAGVSRRQARNN